jgi:signal peptidase I
MWNNELFKTALVIILIIGFISCFWYGSQIVLGTKILPVLAVVSGSMCIPEVICDGWVAVGHTFERTLHRGDLIIIQYVDPKTLNANYPNSDIIVYHRPDNPSELIVHRIINETVIDGKLYFFTKGDGNPPVYWPNYQDGMYDRWYNSNSSIPIGAISQDFIEGKVIMRIPWIGWLPIKVQEMGTSSSIVIPIIVALVILLIIFEFVLPLLKRKNENIFHKM